MTKSGVFDIVFYMRNFVAVLLLTGCVASHWGAPPDFGYVIVDAGEYEIATWQKITDSAAPVRIYIEGDGRAFDGHGRPTHDPTPHGRLVRDLAAADMSANVVYMARPCQYVMSSACDVTDWTDGRFSSRIIDSMTSAIQQIARGRPVVLIGYSGGAMISGLIIEQNPDLNVHEWITVAGVLNHADWTGYFGDTPLTNSLNMNKLPRVPARHYVAERDKVVPRALSQRWGGDENLIIVPNATHNKFPDFSIDKI